MDHVRPVQTTLAASARLPDAANPEAAPANAPPEARSGRLQVCCSIPTLGTPVTTCR